MTRRQTTRHLATYVPLVLAATIGGACAPPVDESEGDSAGVLVPQDTLLPPEPLRLRAVGSGFQLKQGASWKPFFMNGINFGMAVPGTDPGELVTDREAIARWLELAGGLGLNTIRLYTLQFPEFYEEFALYQTRHPDRPLWLVQGIWFDEQESGDYISQTVPFQEEIRNVINSVHGNADIGHRFGKAYGQYNKDISSYVIAYLIGHELEPYLVQDTNDLYIDNTSFVGEYLSIVGATAMESWIVGVMDYTQNYSDTTYQTQRAVGWSNWPTLDPLYHPTQPHDPLISAEDFVGLDLSKVLVNEKNQAGHFVSYHAYPYYPEFVIYEPKYTEISDHVGKNSYLGYLYDLRNHYDGIPLIIGEYGVPSSRGVGKFAPSGMHHGGHDEVAQGLHDVRQLRNIVDSGCAGGILFALMDEWFKRSWVVEKQEIPQESRKFWHNVMNPEQAFGLVAMEPAMPGTRRVDGSGLDWVGSPLAQKEEGVIRKLWASADAAYVYLRLDLAPGNPPSLLYIGLDTYGEELGDTRFPDGLDLESPVGFEFVARLDWSDQSELLVDTSYDTYGWWHNELLPQQLLRPVPNDDGLYVSIVGLVNYEAYYDGKPFKPRENQHSGALRWGNADPASPEFDSLADWMSSPASDIVEIKLPWSILNFTNPASRQMLYDDRDTWETETIETPGFRFVVVAAEPGDSANDAPVLIDVFPASGATPTWTWEPWELPQYKERVKASYNLFQQGIKALFSGDGTPYPAGEGSTISPVVW